MKWGLIAGGLVAISALLLGLLSRRTASVEGLHQPSPTEGALSGESSGQDPATAQYRVPLEVNSFDGKTGDSRVGEPSNAGVRARLQVVDSAGSGVASARTFLIQSDSSWRASGLTNTDGAVEVEIGEMDSYVVALREGMAMGRALIPHPLPDVISVRLDSGGFLGGRVVTASDQRPVSGAWVVARAANRDYPKLTAEHYSWATRGHPMSLSAAANEMGVFEIGGVQHGQPYNVFSGAPGMICIRSQDVAAPRMDILLEVVPVYAAFLEFAAEEGACTSGSLEVFKSDSLRSHDENAVRLPLDILPLAGISDITQATVKANQLLLLFRSSGPESRGRLGPFTIDLASPPFEPYTATFYASKVSDRLDPTIILGHMMEDETGGLELEFSGKRPRNVSSLHRVGGSQVVLDGSHGTYRLHTEFQGARATGGCIMVGTYSVSYQSYSHLPSLDLGVVRIARGATETLLIDVAQRLARISIQVVQANGEPYGGYLPVDIRVKGTNSHEHIDFWQSNGRGEYVIEELSPNTYELAFNGPFLPINNGLWDGDRWIGPVLVGPGENGTLPIYKAD